MATTKTQIPSIPAAPKGGISGALQSVFNNSIKEILEVRLGRRGDPKDRAVTLRELIDSGLAVELLDNPFDPNAGEGPTDFGPPLTIFTDATIPPTPTGLAANAGFTKIIVSWNNPQIGNLAHTEVWRATSNSLGNAVRHDTTEAIVWADSVDPAQQFYYWVRHITTSNIASAFAGSANATTATLTGSQLADNIITNAKLVNDTISAAKIATGTITATEIADDAITTAKILTNAVTADSIASGTIIAANIAGGTITASKIESGTITATQIDGATITANKLVAGSLTSDSGVFGAISAANITTGTLNGSNVTVTNLSASNITGGTLNATNVTISNLNADNAVIGGTLSVAGKAIAGTMGTVKSIVGLTGGSYSDQVGVHNYTQTYWAAAPFHMVTSSGEEMTRVTSSGGTQCKVSWTTPAWFGSGQKTYIVQSFLQPTAGGFGSGSENLTVLVIRQGTDSTSSTTANDYLFTGGQFQSGDASSNPVTIYHSFEASKSTTYYAYLFHDLSDYSSGGSAGSASIIVQGLGA